MVARAARTGDPGYRDLARVSMGEGERGEVAAIPPRALGCSTEIRRRTVPAATIPRGVWGADLDVCM